MMDCRAFSVGRIDRTLAGSRSASLSSLAAINIERVNARMLDVAPVTFGNAAMRLSLQYLETWATVAFRAFCKLGCVRRVLRFGCAVDFRIEVKVHERSPARIDSDSLLTSYGL